MIKTARWGLLVVLPVILIFIFVLIVQSIPSTSILKTKYPVVKYVRDLKGAIDVQVDFVDHRPSSWVSIQNVPSWVKGAVITSEDWSFYNHQGFDLDQIQEALEDSLKRGEKLRGASTLSQQLVKNVFLGQERSWIRKLKEAFLTYDLEAKFSKNQILEFYLNIVEWGQGVVGLGQASRYYFQKSPSQLMPNEAAFLAFLLPSPVKYSSSFRAKRLSYFATQQVKRNLQRMTQAHYITAEQMQHYLEQKFSFEQFQNEEVVPTSEDIEVSEEFEETTLEEIVPDASLVNE